MFSSTTTNGGWVPTTNATTPTHTETTMTVIRSNERAANVNPLLDERLYGGRRRDEVPPDRVLTWGMILCAFVVLLALWTAVWGSIAHAGTSDTVRVQPYHTGLWQSPELYGGVYVTVTHDTLFVTIFDRTNGTWRYAQSTPDDDGDLIDPVSGDVVGSTLIGATGCDSLDLLLYSYEMVGTLHLTPTAPLSGKCVE